MLGGMEGKIQKLNIHLIGVSEGPKKKKKRQQKGRNYKIIGKNFPELKKASSFYLKEPAGCSAD